jgi:hypothetical protein
MRADIHHGISTRVHVCRLLALCALLGFSLIASAGTFPQFMALVEGRATTVGLANGGTLVVTKAPGALVGGSGWTTAGNYGVAAGAVAGDALVGAEGVAAVAGTKVAFGITGTVAKEAIIGGVAGCLTGGTVGCVLGTLTPLALAYATSSGTRLNPTTGAAEYSAGGCVSSCYEYAAQSWSGSAPFLRDPQAACSAGVALFGGTSPSASGSGSSWYCQGVHPDGRTLNLSMSAQSVAPYSPTWYPATTQAVRDALYNYGNPPPGIVDELAKHGNIVWPLGDPTLVGGQPTIKSAKTVTTNPDGSTVTRETVTPLTYAGPTVTAGPSTTTTTTRDPAGVVTGTTTAVTTPGDAGTTTPAEEEPPKDPCDEHPTRVGCLDADTPDGTIPKENKTITFSEENPFGAGQCPADSYADFASIGGAHMKVVDWSGFCAVAVPFRMIVMALAAIMAFFIVMPGGVRE